MWPFRSTKAVENEDDNSVYTEEEYEEDVEYEVEVTDDEADVNESIEDACDSTNRDDHHGADSSEETSNAETESLVESKSMDESHDSDDDEQHIEQSLASDKDVKESIDESSKERLTIPQEDGYSETYIPDANLNDECNTDLEGLEYDKHDDTTDMNGSVEDHKEENDTESDDEEGHDEEEDEEVESVTTFEEKHSLLKLAAEHDRVDIIQSILSSSEQSEERLALLNHEKEPPLHIAISYGSANTTTCLLRLGANPAIRPGHSESKKIIGRTAWELVFGSETDLVTGWFSPKSKNPPIDMADSKREGIRHAFTAEALRTIGADEDSRLKELLDSGMPSSTDIGAGKDMIEWCHDLGAVKCLKLVSKQEEETKSDEKEADEIDTEVTIQNEVDDSNVVETKEPSEVPSTPAAQKVLKIMSVSPDFPTTSPSTPVLIRRLSRDMNDTESLRNRLEELDTLAVNLSTYLDNLAEEVSVCHGLLLMGNGASALASHVRALKETQEVLRHELAEIKSKWKDREMELNSLLSKYKVDKNEIEMMSLSLTRSSSLSKSLSLIDPIELKAQLDKSENKIRRLRASIADMSEESESAMKEVYKRGLIGGIQLVRRLREQIRELEFEISEAKSSDAICATKLKHVQEKIQSVIERESKNDSTPLSVITSEPIPSIMPEYDPTMDTISLMEDPDEKSQEKPSLDSSSNHSGITNPSSQNGMALKNSEKIAQGQSDALMKYNSRIESYMPMDLWQIILRIIGLGRVAVRQQVEELKKQSSTVIIV
jgi:hypothetical protein